MGRAWGNVIMGISLDNLTGSQVSRNLESAERSIAAEERTWRQRAWWSAGFTSRSTGTSTSPTGSRICPRRGTGSMTGSTTSAARRGRRHCTSRVLPGPGYQGASLRRVVPVRGRPAAQASPEVAGALARGVQGVRAEVYLPERCRFGGVRGGRTP